MCTLYITYDLESFCVTKIPIFLVPWHVHKQKLNEKIKIPPPYMNYSFTLGWFFKEK